MSTHHIVARPDGTINCTLGLGLGEYMDGQCIRVLRPLDCPIYIRQVQYKCGFCEEYIP